jgi:hypothetical protein
VTGVHEANNAVVAGGAGGIMETNMPKLPTVRRAPLRPEQRAHLAEVARIRSDANEARVTRASERAATEAAAAAKTAAAHKFADAVEARRLQAQAEGRARVLPMD